MSTALDAKVSLWSLVKVIVTLLLVSITLYVSNLQSEVVLNFGIAAFASWVVLVLLFLNGSSYRFASYLASVAPFCLAVLVNFYIAENMADMAKVTYVFVGLLLVFFAALFCRSLLVYVVVIALGFAIGLLGARVQAKVVSILKPDATLGIELLRTETVNSHFHPLKLDFFKLETLKKSGIYTFSDEVGGDVVWSDAYGRLFLIRDFSQILPFKVRLETNVEGFIENAVPGTELQRFSVKDIKFHEGKLFISHHYWDSKDDCYTLRVSSAPVSVARSDMPGELNFQTIFESSPCIPFEPTFDSGQLMESGGKIAFLGDTLLLTLGDNMYDGRDVSQLTGIDGDTRKIYAQDREVDYGKTIAIDTSTSAARIYSLGHRNPQGLMVDSKGTVYQAEHGPKGGDELNLLEENTNYGWPLVTYGTEYDAFDWPLNRVNGEHHEWRKPLYSWVPSIGISDLTRIESDAFGAWKGDIIVTSLKEKSIYRVRVRDGRVIYVEPIYIGYPIRDIVELSSGHLLLSTTSNVIVRISRVDPAQSAGFDLQMDEYRARANLRNGGQIFAQKCSACHDGSGNIAPSLDSMFSDFSSKGSTFAYSSPLLQANIVWSEENLNRWLASPQSLVPGTKMLFEGIPDPQQRADVILYLMKTYQ